MNSTFLTDSAFFATLQRSSLRIRMRRCRLAQARTSDPDEQRACAERLAEYTRQLREVSDHADAANAGAPCGG